MHMLPLSELPLVTCRRVHRRLSVLTDKQFFGGSNEDLMTARKFNFCPIIRKDFTIDEYQIIEAKSIGADAILLIAAVLDPKRQSRLQH